jgi:hypothetical protein
LDLLYQHKYTIIDWPVGVPAIGPDFCVKCLTADELQALTVPFLKEQMGTDYHSEAPGEDEEDLDNMVPVPDSSFHLRKWSPGEFNGLWISVLPV